MEPNCVCVCRCSVATTAAAAAVSGFIGRSVKAKGSEKPCLRVQVMSDGVVVEQGAPQALASRPDSHFAALLRHHHH